MLKLTVCLSVLTTSKKFLIRVFTEKNKAAQTAWDSYMEENEDNVSLIRSTTRVMIGKWYCLTFKLRLKLSQTDSFSF